MSGGGRGKYQQITATKVITRVTNVAHVSSTGHQPTRPLSARTYQYPESFWFVQARALWTPPQAVGTYPFGSSFHPGFVN